MRLAVVIVYTIVLSAFFSCIDKTSYFHLSGSGANSSDTFYIYGLDRRYEYLDTIIADETGAFEYEATIDTVTPMALLTPSKRVIIIYAEPEIPTIVEFGNTPNKIQRVVGGKLQHLYDSMTTELKTLNQVRRFETIEHFIEQNPLCEVGIMLLRRYLIETPNPPLRKIRDVVNKLGGKLQDNDYITDYKKWLEQKHSISNIKYTAMPIFDYIEMDDSTRIYNGRYKDKFLVLNFWASWDSLSREHMKRICKSGKRYDDNKLTFLNISLDHDTAQWHNAVLADSLIGDNVCDLKMWDNILVQRYNVHHIPYSVLVNPQLLNEIYAISHEKFDNTIDSIISEYDKNKIKTTERRKK